MRFLTTTVFAALLSAPAFAADLGTYRPGTPYNSAVAGGADVCDSQCAGDAQCRGWNYVKPNPQAPGICEYMSSVSTPISSQISISGENMSAASFSSRVTSGGTNTVRVGTQVSRPVNAVRAGQTPSTRRIVRQAPPQRITTQSVSTQPVENMSLTAQQNRYRQGQVGQPQRLTPAPASAPQINRQSAPVQRPMFRPLLDGASAAPRQPQFAPPQRPAARSQMPTSRRATGPRNATPPTPYPPQGAYQAGPQYQAPQNQTLTRGSSRPPIGQPIPAPQQAARPQPSTPSQRLAQFTAQTQTGSQPVMTTGPAALNPQQARKSLFGSLNDDLVAPASSDLSTVTAVPTLPVTQQELGAVLAGGL